MNDDLTFKPVPNTTMPQAIAEQIMVMIAEGRLRPGDRLPTETELMQQFSVGRSTLREGLKSLALAGLIETRRGAGTFVTEDYTGFLSERLKWAAIFGERELRYIVEVRHALEAQTAALAAERATLQQKAQLAALFEALVEATDPDQATEHDTAFHITIAEASHNPLLLNLILSIRSLIREYIRRGYDEGAHPGVVNPQANIVEHGPILAAIQAGRPDEARQAMLAHLDASAELMLALAEYPSQ